MEILVKNCQYCGKMIRGTAESQLVHNVKVHEKFCLVGQVKRGEYKVKVLK